MNEPNHTCTGTQKCAEVCPLVRIGLPCVSTTELVDHFRAIIPQLAR